MFSEREDPDIYFGKKDSCRMPPYLVNLHKESTLRNPYNWIIKNGKKTYKIPDIKFFFCAKHENSGKIESHLWFFKGFCAPTNPQY